MRTYRSPFLILAVVLLGVGIVRVPAAASQNRSDTRIVPGQQIGVVRLGISSRELLQLMGEPTESSQGIAGETRYQWGPDSGQFTVFVSKDGGVTEVLTNLSGYATAEGVRVGSSKLAVIAQLGTPGTSYTTSNTADGRPITANCYSGGMQIDLGENGRVKEIWVRGRKNALKYCDRK